MVLATKAITSGANCLIVGDLGISPGFSTAITGFGSLPQSSDGTHCEWSESRDGDIFFLRGVDSLAELIFHLSTFLRIATSPQVVGNIYAADYNTPTPTDLTTAVTDMTDAFASANGQPADYTEFESGILTSSQLEPGVYKWSTGVHITQSIALVGGCNDVFIFQIA